MNIVRDAAHVVMRGRQYRDRLARPLDPGKDLGGFGSAGKPQMQHVGIEVLEMQQNVIALRPAAAALADLDRHGAGDHVARRKIFGRRRIALHEALAFGIRQIAALAAGSLGDQAAGAVNAGRMTLDELHVLQWQSGAQCHGIAVAGADMRLGRRKISAAAAARRQHDDLRPEQMQRAVFEPPCHDPTALVFIHDQVEHDVLDEELGVVLEALLVKGMEHRMSRPVSGGAGALGQSLAPLHGMAAKRPLIEQAVLGSREWPPEMLELDDRFHGIAAHEFDRVLVAEPVGPLDGVVHVPAPVVLAHIPERRADAALRRDGMAAGRGNPADASGLETCNGHSQCRPQPGAAAPDNDDIVRVMLDQIGGAHGFLAFVFAEICCRCYVDTIGVWRSLASSNPKAIPMRFDLSDLRLFLNVIEAGSITHGAERMHLAIAAASTRIRNMEAVLGTPLLHRERQGVQPTPAGRTLVHHARVLLQQAERMRSELAQYAEGIKGQVRLLSNTNELTEFLPEPLSNFLASHPQVNIDLEERLSDEIVAAVADGTADIGIFAATVEVAGLETLPFRTDRFVLVVAPKHPLATVEHIPFAEVLDFDFVGLDRTSALQRFLSEKAES